VEVEGQRKRAKPRAEIVVRTNQPGTADLWNRFKLHGDPRARDEIIDRYAYLVKITAGRVVTSLPPNLERDDLVSAGIIGLIRAVDQFDAERRVKFETYAIALVRGAILEMLREQDWVPRSIRERVKMLERTYVRLDSELGRPATDEEIAAHVGMSVDELHELLAETSRTSLVSLDDILLGTDSGERISLTDVIQDDSPSPPHKAETHAMRGALARAIERLPEREATSIALYYYEGLTFKEIGKVLKVSESRVYQLHTQAVLRLKGYLSRDVALFH
jgi:RNA polymerase sigma factor for flagellar operon FliA